MHMGRRENNAASGVGKEVGVESVGRLIMSILGVRKLGPKSSSNLSKFTKLLRDGPGT